MSINLFSNLQRQLLLPRIVSCSPRIRTLLVAVALSSVWVPRAPAACSSSVQRLPPSVSSALQLPPPQELASDGVAADERRRDKGPSMTGLWKTVFVADGAVVNIGFNTWHSDGTEWHWTAVHRRLALSALECGRGSGTGATAPSILPSTTTLPIRMSWVSSSNG
jgi:hypothetical protein